MYHVARPEYWTKVNEVNYFSFDNSQYYNLQYIH